MNITIIKKIGKKMSNVLKFEEYVNEGLWSAGMRRAETGEERLEDSFWNGEEMFKVKGFKDYYFSPDPEGFFIDVYHKPSKVVLMSFKDLDWKKENIYYIGPFSIVDTECKPTPEEKRTITSVEFKRAINKVIDEEVTSDYFSDDLG